MKWDDWLYVAWFLCMFLLITGIAPLPKSARKKGTFERGVDNAKD